MVDAPREIKDLLPPEGGSEAPLFFAPPVGGLNYLRLWYRFKKYLMSDEKDDIDVIVKAKLLKMMNVMECEEVT